MTATAETADMPATDFDAIVVGAGFGGMYMLHRLRGLGMRVRVLEAGSSVGGTWYWNRYPGARVDTETMFYSYQFSDELQQEWDWSERYPSRDELWPTPAMWPTGLISGPTCSSTPACAPRSGTRPPWLDCHDGGG